MAAAMPAAVMLASSEEVVTGDAGHEDQDNAKGLPGKHQAPGGL